MARFWPKWRYNGRVMAREVSFYQCLWVTKFWAKFGCSRTPRTARAPNSFIVLRCMWKEPAPLSLISMAISLDLVNMLHKYNTSLMHLNVNLCWPVLYGCPRLRSPKPGGAAPHWIHWGFPAPQTQRTCLQIQSSPHGYFQTSPLPSPPSLPLFVHSPLPQRGRCLRSVTANGFLTKRYLKEFDVLWNHKSSSGKPSATQLQMADW